MDVNPDECMFCHEDLADGETPSSLAFMAHVEGRGLCQQAFDLWRLNMASDYLGD